MGNGSLNDVIVENPPKNSGKQAAKREVMAGRVYQYGGDVSSRTPAAAIEVRVEHVVGRGGLELRDGGVEGAVVSSGGVSSSGRRGQRCGNRVSHCVFRHGLV